MKFSSGHGYAHLKSKKNVSEESLGKNFKKFPNTIHIAKKRKSEQQHHTHTQTHTHTHTHTHTQRNKTKQKKNMHIFSINEDLLEF